MNAALHLELGEPEDASAVLSQAARKDSANHKAFHSAQALTPVKTEDPAHTEKSELLISPVHDDHHKQRHLGTLDSGDETTWSVISDRNQCPKLRTRCPTSPELGVRTQRNTHISATNHRVSTTPSA